MLVLFLTITSENWCFHFQSLEKCFLLVFSLSRISAVPYISLAFTLFSIACYLKYNHYHSPVEAKCNLNIGLVEINFINEKFFTCGLRTGDKPLWRTRTMRARGIHV